MSQSADRLVRLKAKAEQARREADRLRGALDALEARLRQEHGLAPDQLPGALAQAEEELAEAEELLQEKIRAVERDFSDILR